MKDLKQKYNAYKTPFDESAFEHFQTIQQKDKVGQKINAWHVIVVIFLLSIPAAFYISSLITSANTNTQNVSLASKQEKKQDAATKTFNENKVSKSDNKTNTKEEVPIANNDILNKKIANNPTSKVVKIQKEISNTPIIAAQNIVSNTHNYLPPTNQYLATQNINKTDISPPQNPIISPPKNIDISQLQNNIQKIQIDELFEPQAIALETQSLKQDNSQNFDLLPRLSLVRPPTPAKTWGHYRNHLKLSHNYIRFYPESNLLGLIPGYKTPSYFIQGEYFRELNKIISLGSSVGYARGVDPNTQVQDSLGYQRVTFAHLNLYLFLVNSKKHKLYLKAGSGITNAKKQVIAMDATNSILIFERTNMGALMEFSYSYHFTDQWFMSTNVGQIWYDDTLYLGLSLGYAF